MIVTLHGGRLSQTSVNRVYTTFNLSSKSSCECGYKCLSGNVFAQGKNRRTATHPMIKLDYAVGNAGCYHPQPIRNPECSQRQQDQKHHHRLRGGHRWLCDSGSDRDGCPDPAPLAEQRIRRISYASRWSHSIPVYWSPGTRDTARTWPYCSPGQ